MREQDLYWLKDSAIRESLARIARTRACYVCGLPVSNCKCQPEDDREDFTTARNDARRI